MFALVAEPRRSMTHRPFERPSGMGVPLSPVPGGIEQAVASHRTSLSVRGGLRIHGGVHEAVSGCSCIPKVHELECQNNSSAQTKPGAAWPVRVFALLASPHRPLSSRLRPTVLSYQGPEWPR